MRMRRSGPAETPEENAENRPDNPQEAVKSGSAPESAPKSGGGKKRYTKSSIMLDEMQSRLEAGRWLGGSGLAGQDLPAPRIPEWGHCRGSLPQEEARSQAPCWMGQQCGGRGSRDPPGANTCRIRPRRLPQAWRSPTSTGSGELPGGVLSCPWSALPPQDDPRHQHQKTSSRRGALECLSTSPSPEDTFSPVLPTALSPGLVVVRFKGP